MKFVGLLSEISGLPMRICVGAVLAESQAPAVIPKSLRERIQGRGEHQEELEKFGSVPLEWPEDLRRVFAEKDGGQRGATLSVGPLEMRENHEHRSPGPETAHVSQNPLGSMGEEGKPRVSRTASEGTAYIKDFQESGSGDEANRSGGAVGAEDDDDDLQEIDGYTYYYWSVGRTPDMPIPSVEEDNHDPRPYAFVSLMPQPEARARTATTPEGIPLAVSPRTHMFIRGKEYDGPTYMPRSPIHKPRPTPIFSTPSYIRKRFKSLSLASDGEEEAAKEG